MYKIKLRKPVSTCGFLFTDTHNEPSLLLILKWGGELTPAGRVQAEELGRIFRCMYPGGQGRFKFSQFKFKAPSINFGLVSLKRLFFFVFLFSVLLVVLCVFFFCCFCYVLIRCLHSEAI